MENTHSGIIACTAAGKEDFSRNVYSDLSPGTPVAGAIDGARGSYIPHGREL